MSFLSSSRRNQQQEEEEGATTASSDDEVAATTATVGAATAATTRNSHSSYRKSSNDSSNSKETGKRTPKHHDSLNTLHQTLGDEFTSCWGRVEEFLVAGEQEIAHTKPFFFPFSSAATCTNRPLEVDQRDGSTGMAIGGRSGEDTSGTEVEGAVDCGAD
ncbi:hypothetical protein Taro_008371 [Colocasia esculenta]|uniref:Uncharacterized protein n=1 Tax=Colocasia esculenta TaxID=4460 RepID=A0A843TXF0_COLES|nr:hypothetical protein [Colocasia esculenta]